MSIVGTKWKLKYLTRRPDYNELHVTIVKNLDEAGRIRVIIDSTDQYISVKPNNIVSRQDESVDATVVSAALSHLKTKAAQTRDTHMDTFLKRYERGDFDGALSAAATWSLKRAK